MVTVQEIHNAFFSAEEKLLKEAVEIINTPKEAKNIKAAILKKLGFGNSKPVKDASQLQAKQDQAKKIQDRIGYFRQHYPNNKFINEEEVKRICEKYGLLLGGAFNYTGDIPEKNLKEIENFKLREVDCVTTSNPVGIRVWELPQESLGLDRDGMFRNFGMMIPGAQESEREMMRQNDRIREAQRERQRQIDYDRQMRAAMEYYVSGGALRSSTQMPNSASRPPVAQKPNFKICAPKADFNILGYIEVGHVLVYDPVVLQPVYEGYLIVSAWGEEASDPSVVNEVMN